MEARKDVLHSNAPRARIARARGVSLAWSGNIDSEIMGSACEDWPEGLRVKV